MHQIEITRNGLGIKDREVLFAHSIADLALALHRALWCLNSVEVEQFRAARQTPVRINASFRTFWLDIYATTPEGRTLNVFELAAWGERLYRARAETSSAYYRWLHRWHGEGPVPGVSKSRGGHHYFRNPKTQAERRQGQPILEDGEPAIRRARKPRNIPTAWDDVLLHPEKNWKSQHKGRKSWEKPARAGMEMRVKRQIRPFNRLAAMSSVGKL